MVREAPSGTAQPQAQERSAGGGSKVFGGRHVRERSYTVLLSLGIALVRGYDSDRT